MSYHKSSTKNDSEHKDDELGDEYDLDDEYDHGERCVCSLCVIL